MFSSCRVNFLSSLLLLLVENQPINGRDMLIHCEASKDFSTKPGRS